MEITKSRNAGGIQKHIYNEVKKFFLKHEDLPFLSGPPADHGKKMHVQKPLLQPITPIITYMLLR